MREAIAYLRSVSRATLNPIEVLQAVIQALTLHDNRDTGWGNYPDSTYTEGSPFEPTADTWTALPNDKAGSLLNESQLPSDVATFYDGSVITGLNGDGMLVTVELTAKPTTATVTYLDIAFDIGGAVGRIYPRTLSFPKGQNVARTISFTTAVYSLDTWQANGAEVQVNPTAAIDIYDIRYIIHRVHRAR